jgi:hypothetical protein
MQAEAKTQLWVTAVAVVTFLSAFWTVTERKGSSWTKILDEIDDLDQPRGKQGMM